MKAKQKDNSTLNLKASLRHNLLREIDNPVVLETHGGYGHLYERCYRGLSDVIAIRVATEVLSRSIQWSALIDVFALSVGENHRVYSCTWFYVIKPSCASM